MRFSSKAEYKPASPSGESLASIWKDYGKKLTDTQLGAIKGTISATVDGIKYPSRQESKVDVWVLSKATPIHTPHTRSTFNFPTLL